MVYYPPVFPDEGNCAARTFVPPQTFLIKNLLREMRLLFHHGITKARRLYHAGDKLPRLLIQRQWIDSAKTMAAPPPPPSPLPPSRPYLHRISACSLIEVQGIPHGWSLHTGRSPRARTTGGNKMKLIGGTKARNVLFFTEFSSLFAARSEMKLIGEQWTGRVETRRYFGSYREVKLMEFSL